jgi:peptidyl-prolyl cis-trans isomerase C
VFFQEKPVSVRPLISLLALALATATACSKPPATATSQQTAAPPTPATVTPPAPAPQPATGQATPGAATPGAATPGAAPAAATPAAPPGPKPVPAVLPQVLAKVDGQPIGRAELEAAIKAAETNAGRSIPAEQRDTVYRNLLDQVILFKLLSNEAKVRGIVVTPQEVTDRMTQIKGQFPSEAEFQKTLTEHKTTITQLEAEQRRDLLHAKTIEAEVAPKVTVTPQDLDAYYKANPKQFVEPETVRASHILIAIPQNATPEQKQAARTEAEGVLKRAKAGEDFAALAKQYSKDSGSAAVGGDLNYFPKEQMVPPFSAAAFALKPGEISNLVETQFGLHIIKLTDRRNGRTVPLTEVSERLSNFLKQRRQQEMMQQYLQSLKAKYRVEILI